VARKEILNSLTLDQEKYYASLCFNQLYAFYKGIRERPRGRLIADVLFENTLQAGDYDWNTAFVTGLNTVFTDLGINCSYTKDAVYLARRAVLRRVIQPRILRERIDGHDIGKLKKAVYQHFRDLPGFWLLSIFLIYAPRKLLSIGNRIRKFI
jgi:hypothetical protein